MSTFSIRALFLGLITFLIAGFSLATSPQPGPFDSLNELDIDNQAVIQFVACANNRRCYNSRQGKEFQELVEVIDHESWFSIFNHLSSALYDLEQEQKTLRSTGFFRRTEEERSHIQLLSKNRARLRHASRLLFNLLDEKPPEKRCMMLRPWLHHVGPIFTSGQSVLINGKDYKDILIKILASSFGHGEIDSTLDSILPLGETATWYQRYALHSKAYSDERHKLDQLVEEIGFYRSGEEVDRFYVQRNKVEDQLGHKKQLVEEAKGFSLGQVCLLVNNHLDHIQVLEMENDRQLRQLGSAQQSLIQVIKWSFGRYSNPLF